MDSVNIRIDLLLSEIPATAGQRDVVPIVPVCPFPGKEPVNALSNGGKEDKRDRVMEGT